MAISKQWRGLCDEVASLCDTLGKIPERCECGDALAHLDGACPCCHGHVAETAVSGGQSSCGERIAQLRAELALLCEDFKKAAAPLQRGASAGGPFLLRRDLVMAAGDLGKMLAALEELDRAVVGFRRTCSVAEMKKVKRHGASLLASCRKVDAELAAMPAAGSEDAGDGEE